MNGSSVTTWEEFTKVIQENANSKVEMLVERGEETESPIIPQEIEDMDGDKIGQAGVYMANRKVS